MLLDPPATSSSSAAIRALRLIALQLPQRPIQFRLVKYQLLVGPRVPSFSLNGFLSTTTTNHARKWKIILYFIAHSINFFFGILWIFCCSKFCKRKNVIRHGILLYLNDLNMVWRFSVSSHLNIYIYIFIFIHVFYSSKKLSLSITYFIYCFVFFLDQNTLNYSLDKIGWKI